MIKEADRRGISVRQVVLEKKLLPENELDALLDPRRLIKPG